MKSITQIAIDLTTAFGETNDVAIISKAICYEFGARMAMIYAQRWIPLTEEQPELHKAILIKDEEGFWDKGIRIHISGDNQYSSSSGDVGTVVYWKPESREL